MSSHLPDSDWVTQVDSKLAELSTRQTELDAKLEANNEATFEIRDILSTAKGAFRFFGWIGQFAGWAMKIGALCTATYAAVKLAFPHLFRG